MATCTRRTFLKAAALGSATLVRPRPARADRTARAKPNIVLVLTDDLGWTDTSVRMMPDRADSASDFYRTPALAKMAADGMVFSNAYAAAPVCTPSRAAVQFGKTPARLRQTVVHDVLAQVRGIDCKGERSIAQVVKSADASYRTGHFGKWGFPPRSPTHAGYDETDGPTNNFHGDFRALNDRRPLPGDDPKRMFSVTARANDFMARQQRQGQPFFLQVSHYAIHVHSAARRETVAKCLQRPRGRKCSDRDYASPPPPPNAWMMTYAAMIEDLDAALGLLLKQIDDLGIRDRTYVIFTSDNGGGFRTNRPLRSGKATLWEGGLRVPMVIRGPGVSAGTTCPVPVAGWDLLPTVHDLIGSSKPLPAGIDGGSLRPLFARPKAGSVRRTTEALVFHFPWYGAMPMSAIRLGDLKLVRDLNTGRTALFDVVRDLSETKDLTASMPDKARTMRDMLDGYLRSVGAENLDAMRDARRDELLRYTDRATKDMDRARTRLAEMPNGARREKLQAELAGAERQLRAHQRALKHLKDSEKTRAW